MSPNPLKIPTPKSLLLLKAQVPHYTPPRTSGFGTEVVMRLDAVIAVSDETIGVSDISQIVAVRLL